MDEKFSKTLRILAPGTALREGLENILKARTGGLIVVGDTPTIMNLVDGGFKIDSEYSPASLYELAKMDGAIIVSHDARRILYANAQLIPDPTVPSFETGIRHRTAERVARQTGELVIAISQRRNVITLYRGTIKYVLRDISVILTKANQAIQTLERYKTVLNQALVNLSALEFEDLVTVADVASAIQRSEMVMRMVEEIETYISELGDEGRLISMQLQELVSNVEDEGFMLIKDYCQVCDKSPSDIKSHLATWTAEDLLDPGMVTRVLGLGGGIGSLDQSAVPRGYRILRKIPRLPLAVIDNLVSSFGNLQRILNASIEELDNVEGIGEVRARAIKDGLRRLHDQVLLDHRV